MSLYVKYINLNHLLEIGVKVFYGPYSAGKVLFNPYIFVQVGT
jgi:hypothetical protein